MRSQRRPDLEAQCRHGRTAHAAAGRRLSRGSHPGHAGARPRQPDGAESRHGARARAGCRLRARLRARLPQPHAAGGTRRQRADRRVAAGVHRTEGRRRRLPHLARRPGHPQRACPRRAAGREGAGRNARQALRQGPRRQRHQPQGDPVLPRLPAAVRGQPSAATPPGRSRNSACCSPSPPSSSSAPSAGLPAASASGSRDVPPSARGWIAWRAGSSWRWDCGCWSSSRVVLRSIGSRRGPRRQRRSCASPASLPVDRHGPRRSVRFVQG